jgi:adenylate kinase
LSKELSIPHISTGDLFRENISKDTELGKKAKSYTNEGKLVPDEIVLQMLFDRVSRPDAANGYLLDGFPRTIPQAEALDKQLGATKLIVLDLEVPDDTILKRALGRLTCGSCGEMFNHHFSPPKKEGICDKCRGELKKRADDTLEVIQERLRVYHEQTKPLESFYEKKGLLHRVDGTQSPDLVYQSLLEKLKPENQKRGG